jgi:hypothetical protein
MKTLVLVLFLSAAAGVLIWRRSSPAPAARVAVPDRPSARATNAIRPAWFQELPSREKFASPWAALAAGDHAGFIALLREAGCPEETVRAFALAALGRIHQQSVEAPLRAETRAAKFWQLMPSEIGGENWNRRMHRAKTALNAELARLLQTPAPLVRRDFELVAPAETGVSPELEAQVLAQAQIHDAELREQAAGFARDAFGNLVDPESRTQLRALRERQRGEWAELLGAEAAELRELRSSPEANYVRGAMPAAKDEAEFRRMVRAARDVGVEEPDVIAQIMTEHHPAQFREEFPTIREAVLKRFRELSDPQRMAELERELAEEQRRAEEEKAAQVAAGSLNHLESVARAGGVELTPAEVRDLAAAIRARGAELEREWGAVPTNPTATETAALMDKLRVELERVAVATVGEKGRAIVAEMVRQQQPRQP